MVRQYEKRAGGLVSQKRTLMRYSIRGEEDGLYSHHGLFTDILSVDTVFDLKDALCRLCIYQNSKFASQAHNAFCI